MTSVLGLVELLVVLVGAMGWGAYELWSVRRSRRGRTPKKPDGTHGS